MTTYDLTADGSEYLINSLDQIDPAVIAALASGGALYWIKTDTSGAIVAHGGHGSGTPSKLSGSLGDVITYRFPTDVTGCAIFVTQDWNSSATLPVQALRNSGGNATDVNIENTEASTILQVVIFG